MSCPVHSLNVRSPGHQSTSDRSFTYALNIVTAVIFVFDIVDHLLQERTEGKKKVYAMAECKFINLTQ